MCVVSMVMDHYQDRWKPLGPWVNPVPYQPTETKITFFPQPISKEEIDALRKEIEEMKALLKRAKLYDEANNEPDCEMEEKMAFVRKVVELAGLDFDEMLKEITKDTRTEKPPIEPAPV